MIPCDRTFNGTTTYIHEGRTYYRYYSINRSGNYQIRLRFVSTNSCHKQGIALFFNDFKGKILVNNREENRLKIPRGPFGHYVFKEEQFPSGEFSLYVYARSGGLDIMNASFEKDGFVCNCFGCAFWMEPLSPNKFRVHCNDHDYDDDFDDLIFDMEILCEADVSVAGDSSASAADGLKS